MAGPAEDLEDFGFVCTAECEGEDVINIPSFAGVDLLRAACASPFLFRKRFSLKEVEKTCRRVGRVIVYSGGVIGASPFKDLLLLIGLILLGFGLGQVFKEIDFPAGIELGEGQSFPRTDGEVTPCPVRAQRALSDPACDVFR